MNETMKAILLRGPNDFVYCDVPKPSPGEYEVLCRVESVSICGTDPHIIQGDFPGVWPQSFPLIPGHEWSGVVVALGEKADCFGWKVGDRVCGIANLGCGMTDRPLTHIEVNETADRVAPLFQKLVLRGLERLGQLP